MKSSIFYTDAYKDIELRVQELLNSHEEFLSPSTARSTRAVGDAIESILGSSFDAILGDLCKEYSAAFARRAMADLAFIDTDDFYYVVDVKTHRTDTKFNMPNLVSVQRLARFYEEDTNHSHRYKSQICTYRVSRMGLSYHRRIGMGSDSNRKLKFHNREPSVLTQEVDD